MMLMVFTVASNETDSSCSYQILKKDNRAWKKKLALYVCLLPHLDGIILLFFTISTFLKSSFICLSLFFSH